MGSFIQPCVSFTILTRRVSQEQGDWLTENQLPWAAILGKPGSFLRGMEKFLSCWRPQGNKGGNRRQVPALSLSHKGKLPLSSPSPLFGSQARQSKKRTTALLEGTKLLNSSSSIHLPWTVYLWLKISLAKIFLHLSLCKACRLHATKPVSDTPPIQWDCGSNQRCLRAGWAQPCSHWWQAAKLEPVGPAAGSCPLPSH